MSAAAPRARRAFWPWLLLAGVVSAGGGGAALAFDEGPTAAEIVLLRREGIRITCTDGGPLDQGDFYLRIRTGTQGVRRTPTREQAIGNGLRWPLAPPVLVADVREVEVFDEDILSDDELDRVRLDGTEAHGECYTIRLDGMKRSPIGLGALGGLAAGALLGLLGLVGFVRSQAV